MTINMKHLINKLENINEGMYDEPSEEEFMIDFENKLDELLNHYYLRASELGYNEQHLDSILKNNLAS